MGIIDDYNPNKNIIKNLKYIKNKNNIINSNTKHNKLSKKIICYLNEDCYILEFNDKERINCIKIFNKLKNEIGKDKVSRIKKNINNLDISNFYFIHQSKLLDYEEIIETFNNTEIINVKSKLRGGIVGIGKLIKAAINAILKILDKILFEPLLKPIMPIFKALYIIFVLIPLYLIKLSIWSVRFLLWFLLEVASPQKLVNDFVGTLKLVTFTLVNAVFQIFLIFGKKMVNLFGNTVISGFWGWDKAVVDEWDHKYSEYHNCKNECRNSKCYKTTQGGIPFSVIIGTIICPPIGVFMEYGITGWLNILICIMLTFLFYFPGLLYALIVLYC